MRVAIAFPVFMSIVFMASGMIGGKRRDLLMGGVFALLALLIGLVTERIAPWRGSS
jgi:hypothetical protein